MMNHDTVRLDKFKGSNFTRWKDKLKFLLTTVKIFCIVAPDLEPLSEPILNDIYGARMEKEKREEDKSIFRWHILNALSDCLYDLYTNNTSTKEIWEPLETKYKVHDKIAKKFLIFKYFGFKILDNLSLLGQVYEL